MDWFVSPAFNFANGGNISLKINLYYANGSPKPVDEFAMYLFTGNADPALATQKNLLASFTHMAASPPVWKDSNNITIPATAGNSYIAFKYKTTNNWITPRVDDISITANPTGINETSAKENNIQIFPNPAHDKIEIKTESGTPFQKIQLIDVHGRIIKEQKGSANILNIEDVPAGNYIIKLFSKDKIIFDKILVTKK